MSTWQLKKEYSITFFNEISTDNFSPQALAEFAIELMTKGYAVVIDSEAKMIRWGC